MKELIAKIERLQRQADEAWRKACEYDNVPSEELFIVFSNDNPYAVESNNINIELFACREKLIQEFGNVR